MASPIQEKLHNAPACLQSQTKQTGQQHEKEALISRADRQATNSRTMNSWLNGTVGMACT